MISTWLLWRELENKYSPNRCCWGLPLDKPNWRPEDNGVKEATNSHKISRTQSMLEKDGKGMWMGKQTFHTSFLSFLGTQSYYQKRDNLNTTFPNFVSDILPMQI